MSSRLHDRDPLVQGVVNHMVKEGVEATNLHGHDETILVRLLEALFLVHILQQGVQLMLHVVELSCCWMVRGVGMVGWVVGCALGHSLVSLCVLDVGVFVFLLPLLLLTSV